MPHPTISLPIALSALLAATAPASGRTLTAPPSAVSTFSIVAADPAAGEVGVAVASRFFSVGSVVPWARAGAGAVATQSFANTSWGPRGLDLLAAGLSPAEVLAVLERTDEQSDRRQAGIVAADGKAVSFTGKNCNAWAGGRSGNGYAVQGNILTGEEVVAAMERAFLDTPGDLAGRLFAALAAGEGAGGDSRGKQSAALIVHREGGGYGGFNDRAIDVRVDDHPDPITELGRLVRIARMNDAWNRGWTLFTRKRHDEALEWQEKAAALAPDNAEVLYDLGVIRLAAGRRAEALAALRLALELNPKLKAQARVDTDLDALRTDERFRKEIR